MTEEFDGTESSIAPSNDNRRSLFRQSLQLIAAFREIDDPELRQAVIRVVQDIAEASGKPGPAGVFVDEEE